MTKISERNPKEFRIVLQPLDAKSDELEDSPTYIDFKPRDHDWESSSISSEISLEHENVQSCLGSPEITVNSLKLDHLSKLLQRHNLGKAFETVELEPEQVKVFRWLKQELCDLNIGTVYLAFNIFLQFYAKTRSDIATSVVASALLAAKYKDTVYYIPLLDELVESAKYSPLLTESKCPLTMESVQTAEIMIAVELDWNFRQATILDACYFTLGACTEFENAKTLLRDSIEDNQIYAMPILGKKHDLLL